MEELQPPETQLNGAVPPSMAYTGSASTKRQRRPNVRLGDIGDQAYDNRKVKQCRPPRNRHASGEEYLETLEGEVKEGNLGSRIVRDSNSRRGGGGSARRIRSNWMAKTDGSRIGEGDNKEDERFRDFTAEDSDSRLKEESQINSPDNDNDNNTAIDAGIVREREEDPSENHGRNWNGVKVWLNQLGLGGYAPIFEIHEVDDEVLPLLTLEDLKDMGIHAVGSRRKMFSSIEKLTRGFS